MNAQQATLGALVTAVQILLAHTRVSRVHTDLLMELMDYVLVS